MKYIHPTHGWDVVKLYRNLTSAQLTELAEDLRSRPENKRTGSVWLYTPATIKRLDAIGWAITYHLQDSKRVCEACGLCDCVCQTLAEMKR